MAASYIEALLYQEVNTFAGVKEHRWNNTAGTGEAGLGTAVDVTFRFLTAAPAHAETPGDGSGFAPLTNGQKAAARAILGIYEQYCNINFVESAAADANMLFGRNATSAAAYAYPPELLPPIGPQGNDGGDVWISTGSEGNLEVGVGQMGWQVLVHEIGHAIGLKHSFQPDGAQPTLPMATDNHQYTVMSYTAAQRTKIRVVDDGLLSYEFLGVAAPMLYDIAAIQHLYGANMTTRAGNNSYTFDPDTPFFECIWDAGGTDTISVANFTGGCTIDLNAGKFSSIDARTDALPDGYVESPEVAAQIYNGVNNLSIAFGVTIERATGGSGADRLIGNDVANTLTGNGGNDNLTGNAGNDTMTGGNGNDIMNGGVGIDKIKGDAGTDTIIYGAGDGIDGGLGNLDVLKIASGSLDLTTLINTRIINIEKINMTAGGANTLKINATDVLALSSTVNTVTIMGEAADTVDIVGAFVTGGDAPAGYTRYTSGNAVLIIDSDINVNFI